MTNTATVSLRDFQDDFAAALIAPDLASQVGPAITALINQPGFAVYRNTVIKGCIDALQANYPAVERLVGTEWFRAAAAIFVRAELPVHPTLVDYGAGFAEFLRTFAPAAELPYLDGVARLDRFWTEAHIACDEPSLQPTTIVQMDFEHVVLRPHASARWAWFNELPIFTIWQRNRDATFDHASAAEIAWHAEGALITRPHGAVQSMMLNGGGCALLDACVGGRPLPEAAEAALAADGNTNLTQLLSTLLKAGAFADAVDEREGAADG